MATNGINARVSTTSSQRRLSWLISGIALRLLIAFVISWLIIMAFFVSGVVSH
ncbi:MAG TPA: hypothetical protein VEV19_17210 [Ktedonobacteraceae bacterium]|nr:hypothetical protein [Ktedonobacteraceae bacterium]